MRNPRNVLMAFSAVALIPLVAAASGLHVHGTLNGDSDYVWSDDNHELVLHSNAKTHGVVVDSTRPVPLHGLRAGDVIVSIDGHRVAGLGDLQNAIHRHARSPASVGIHRAGADVALAWPYDELKELFPEPPAPPAPPPPPPPPPR